MAAVASIAFIIVAVAVLVVSPRPSTVVGWFTLFQRNALLGLVDFDLLMLATYMIMGVIYLALYGALQRGHEPIMALATVCGLASIGIYLTSNTAFNMLWLSSRGAH